MATEVPLEKSTTEWAEAKRIFFGVRSPPILPLRPRNLRAAAR